MKRTITVIITALILVLIQSSTAYDLIRVALGAKPDLLLIFLSFIAFKYGSFEGTIYGFIIGLLQDVISNATFGSYALIFLNIGFFIGFFNNRIFIRQLAAGIFITLIAYAIKIVALFLIMAIYSDLSSVAVLIRAELLVGLPLTVIIASPMFLLLDKIAYFVYDRRKIRVDDSTEKFNNE